MPRRTPALPAPLACAVRRFDKWRSTRKRKRHIPDSLWHLATKLGGKYGINRTARTLRLDYYDLKGRVEDAVQSDVSGSETRPAFVEMVPAPCTSTAECVVEFEDPRGVKMKIHFKAVGQAELTALGRLFWRSER